MPDTKSKGGPGKVNLETHPLVARLHADPDELTQLVALVGYLGPSKREGYVRLYADLTFRNYYEVPAEGILSTTPADAEDENSPTTVHVAGDAQVERVSITSQSAEARFLQGSISGDYLGTAGAGAGGWTMAGCTVTLNCQQGAAQVGAPSMVYSCWCNITKNNCQQGAAQAAQPFTAYCHLNTYECQRGAAQAGQAYWPASPTCWCFHTQQNCQQGAAQVGQPYTDTFFHTCGCSFGQYTCNNCGQAGAQANAEPWPASPTCWCNITRNCARQQEAQPYLDTTWASCACTYEGCGRAGARAAAQPWPASPTCWCFHTQQGCT